MKFIYATIIAALLFSGCGNEGTQKSQEAQEELLAPPAPPQSMENPK